MICCGRSALHDRSSGPPATIAFDQQIVVGADQRRDCGPVLAVLLGRYQLVDPAAWSDPLNAPLVAVLDALNFYADPTNAALRSVAARLGGGARGARQHAWRGAAGLRRRRSADPAGRRPTRRLLLGALMQADGQRRSDTSRQREAAGGSAKSAGDRQCRHAVARRPAAAAGTGGCHVVGGAADTQAELGPDRALLRRAVCAHREA